MATMLKLEHSQDVAMDLGGRLLLDEATADIIFKVQDGRLPAHKAILSARSEYFEKMLCGKMKERDAREVDMTHAFGYDTMRELLRYIYTGCIEIHAKEDGFALMTCADCYGISKLRDSLRRFVVKNLTCPTCFDTLRLAEKYRQEYLEDECLQFIRAHAISLLKPECFAQLDAPMALKILQDEGLQERLPYCYQAAVKWCEHRGMRCDAGGNLAEWPTPSLTPGDTEMLQYICTCRQHLSCQGQACCVEAASNDIRTVFDMATGATSVCRMGTGSKWQAASLDTLTSRTRLRVLAMGSAKGLRLAISYPDVAPEVLTGEDLFGASTRGILFAVDENGYLHLEGRMIRSPVNWGCGAVMEVVKSPTSMRAQKVSVVLTNPGKECELFNTIATTELKLWLVLRRPGVRVSVACLH